MIYDEYAAYLSKYKLEYGERTIVLFECGSFFEIYDDGSGQTNMKYISEMLNIVVSRRNKSILEVSKANCEMAGFPSHSLKKFINILVSFNYTVVLVTQITPPPNPKRAVTEIISPGTFTEVNHADSNNLMNIYIEEYDGYKSGNEISMGCSVIDLSTGKSYIYETSTYKRDKSYCFDELQRLLSIYTPREIEVMSQGATVSTMSKISDNVDFGNCHIHDKIGKMNPDLLQIGYQTQILTRVFTNTGLLSVLEFLNLERKPLAAISYTRLIEFAFKHNENILTKIKQPEVEEEQGSLTLSYNAAQQLDIYNKGLGKYDSLLNILNNCKTAIGRRYFKFRFLHPMTNTVLIERQYDSIEKVNADVIREELANVYDIERLFRKCLTTVIHPHEFYNVKRSLVALQKCMTIYNTESKSPAAYVDNIISYINTYFETDQLQLYNIDAIETAMFKVHDIPDISDGVLPQLLHDLQRDLDVHISVFNDFIKQFPENTFKLEYNDKEGFIISTTNKRYQDIVVKPNMQVWFAGTKLSSKDMSVKTNTANIKLNHKLFDEYNSKIVSLKCKVYFHCQIAFKNIIKTFSEKFQFEFYEIIKYVEDVDYVTTCRYNAFIYKLNRPVIVDVCQSSYAKFKGLRHLIIENVQKDIKYVSNDLDIGTESQKGLLLYGINSAGKSSLMKSVGIAIIMAQCGMYVPCDHMQYSPYAKIFTRILSCDDIFRGQSTFTKEIVELRNILSRCDSNSLVIGDELCSGTESQSALAIVSTGILMLDRKQSSFLFATHLHDLISIAEVRALIEDRKSLKIYHLSVTCCPENKKLIYDRKLKPGSGTSLYGIEVCRTLGMDAEFIDTANEIRQRICGHGLCIGNKSKYNHSVYVGVCMICKKSAEEVHHIKQQCSADEHGYIENHHKNAAFNLVSLCQKCHDDIHNKKIYISGFIQTSQGRELKYQHVSGQNDDDDKHVYEEIRSMFDTSTLKTKKEKLECLSRTFNLSKYKIMQILKS